MPFEQKDRSGDWMSLRDIARSGFKVLVARGFLENDDNNTFKGNPSPRHIIHGTINDAEYQIGSPKSGSRPLDLEDMADYLDKAEPGSYIEFTVDEIKLEGGNTFNAIVVVNTFDA